MARKALGGPSERIGAWEPCVRVDLGGGVTIGSIAGHADHRYENMIRCLCFVSVARGTGASAEHGASDSVTQSRWWRLVQ